jgi:hypothetical protein
MDKDTSPVSINPYLHMVLWDMDRNHRYTQHTYDPIALEEVAGAYLGEERSTLFHVVARYMEVSLQYAPPPAKDGAVRLGPMEVTIIKTEGDAYPSYQCELLLNNG